MASRGAPAVGHGVRTERSNWQRAAAPRTEDSTDDPNDSCGPTGSDNEIVSTIIANRERQRLRRMPAGGENRMCLTPNGRGADNDSARQRFIFPPRRLSQAREQAPSSVVDSDHSGSTGTVASTDAEPCDPSPAVSLPIITVMTPPPDRPSFSSDTVANPLECPPVAPPHGGMPADASSEEDTGVTSETPGADAEPPPDGASTIDTARSDEESGTECSSNAVDPPLYERTVTMPTSGTVPTASQQLLLPPPTQRRPSGEPDDAATAHSRRSLLESVEEASHSESEWDALANAAVGGSDV